MNAAVRASRFHLQLSIRGFLIFTGAIALGLAAIREPSPAWACAWTSIALVSIFLAIIGSFSDRAGRRPFWTGFAICAGLYFLFAARFAGSHVLASLATTKAIHSIDAAIGAYDPRPILGPEANGEFDTDSQTIGQSEWAVALGSIGGLLAQGLAAARRRTRQLAPDAEAAERSGSHVTA